MNDREETFREVLEEYKGWGRYSEADLAELIGCPETTVRRWLARPPNKGTAKPQRRHITTLTTRLRIRDRTTNALRELTQVERERLYRAAGHELDEPANRATSGKRYTVYSYSYSYHAFPVRWDERGIDLEEQNPSGVLYLMLDYISEVTRMEDYYRYSYHLLQEQYHPDQVQIYMKRLEKRRDLLYRRALTNEVRHLYSLSGLEKYLAPEPDDPRYAKIPQALRQAQLQRVVDWSRQLGNFSVRISARPLPANFEIIGRDIVLLEFDKRIKDLKQHRLMGIELRGERAVAEFKHQFEASWNDTLTSKSVDDIKTLFPWIRLEPTPVGGNGLSP